MPPRSSIPGVSANNSDGCVQADGGAARSTLQLSRQASLSVPPSDEASVREEATAQGFRLLDYLIHRIDPADRAPLCIPFLALPLRSEYPDYYELIKTPVSLEQVRRRLQARQYSTLEDVRNALETIWRNAKRYNLKGSEIYEKARVLHSATRESYVDLVEKNELAPVNDGAPSEGKPGLMERSATLSKTETTGAPARLDYDENARGPPTVSLRLKKAGDLPYDEDSETLTDLTTTAASPAVVSVKLQSDALTPTTAAMEDTEMADVSSASAPIPSIQTPTVEPVKATGQVAKEEAEEQGAMTASPALATQTPDSDGEGAEDLVELSDLPGYDPVTGLLNGKPVDTSLLTRDGKFDRRKRPGPRGKRLKSTLRHLVAEMRLASRKNGRLLCEYFIDLPPKHEFPDYYQVITKPISLNLIESKAVHNRYVNPYSLVTDLKLMAANAKYYNEENSEVWNAAEELDRYTDEQIIAPLLADGFSLDPQDMRQSALPLEYAAASPIAAHAAAFKRAQGLGIQPQQSRSPEPGLSKLRSEAGMTSPVASAAPSAYGHAGAPYPGTRGAINGGAARMSPSAVGTSASPLGTPFGNPSGRQVTSPSMPWQGQGRPVQHPGGYPFPMAAQGSPQIARPNSNNNAMSPPHGQARQLYPPSASGQAPFQRPMPPGAQGMPFAHQPMPNGALQGAPGVGANVRIPKRIQGEAPPDPYSTASLVLDDGKKWRRKPVSPAFVVKVKAKHNDEREVVLLNDLSRVHSLCLGAGCSGGGGRDEKGVELSITFKLGELVRTSSGGKKQDEEEEIEDVNRPWKVLIRYNNRIVPFDVLSSSSTQSLAKTIDPNAFVDPSLSSKELAAKRNGMIEVEQGASCRVTLQIRAATSVFDLTISPGAPDSTLTTIANTVDHPQQTKAKALLQTNDKYRIFLQRT